MNEKDVSQDNSNLKAWSQQQMDAAVHELTARGYFESVAVEAKTAWVMPYTLLIGRVREQGKSGGFQWFICGDAPLTLVHSSSAATPREAARHFSLQWQLDAEKTGASGSELATKAAALYELVEDSAFWRQTEAD